jgi:hypothetical protein
MKKSKLINLAAGKVLLAASHVAFSGEICPDPDSKSQSVENTPLAVELIPPEDSFADQNDFYVVGSDVSSLKFRVSGIERCGQLVDIYLVYSVDLASPGDWPRTQTGEIFVGQNIEVFGVSLNVPSQDQLDFLLDLNQVREKFSNKELVFIQAATFPSGNLGFEKAQISKLINLALYPRPVCQGEQKAEPVVPCF